jgi:predicted Rossmann-fold nucleotide-binding protein
MKKIQIILLVLIIVGIGLIFTQKYWVDGVVNFILQQSVSTLIKSDPLNITYVIEGKRVNLANGKAEGVQVFGEPVYGDLSGDGVKDAALFLTVQLGGSGTFFYAVEAIKMGEIYKGTNAVFLGDRIAPQNINIIDGQAVANFAERKPDEPFTTPPSIGKSIWFNLGKDSLTGYMK